MYSCTDLLHVACNCQGYLGFCIMCSDHTLVVFVISYVQLYQNTPWVFCANSPLQYYKMLQLSMISLTITLYFHILHNRTWRFSARFSVVSSTPLRQRYHSQRSAVCHTASAHTPRCTARRRRRHHSHHQHCMHTAARRTAGRRRVASAGRQRRHARRRHARRRYCSHCCCCWHYDWRHGVDRQPDGRTDRHSVSQ